MTAKTILLVEDNPMDEELTVRAFKKNGISNPLVVARDGVEALEYLHGKPASGESRPLPEVVLLDLKLPKLDGLDVLKALRAHDATKLLPVVILSSSNEEQDLIRSYSLGANSFVRKPVDFAQFLEATRQLGLYWLVLNQTPPHA